MPTCVSWEDIQNCACHIQARTCRMGKISKVRRKCKKAAKHKKDAKCNAYDLFGARRMLLLCDVMCACACCT